MRKKVLLFLLLFGFLIPGVSADVDITCSVSQNLAKPNNFVKGLVKFSDTVPDDPFYYVDVSYNSLIEVESSTDYSFKADSSVSSSSSPWRIRIFYYDKSFNYIKTTSNVTNSNFFYSFTTTEDTSYISLHLYHVNLDALNSFNYQLQKGKNITDSYFYEQCPPKPIDPTPMPGDTTLSDYYSIYLDKLKLLSDYTLENKFLLSFVCIIILFCVLDLFLILINGRRKK